MSTAEICENLGIDPDSLDEADAFVAERVQFFDDLEEVRASRELPDGTFVHLHQLVVGEEGRPHVVTYLGHEAITLVEIEPPVEDDQIAFLEERTITYGQFCMNFEAKTVGESDRASEEQPVWAY